MIKIVGVRFRKAGKIYYFDPAGMEIETGTHVIVETARGIEFGTVMKMCIRDRCKRASSGRKSTQ